MSTNGFIGLVVDGVEKITYNHSDSYPSWLGVRVLEWLSKTVGDHDALGVEGLRLRASTLTMVEDDEDSPVPDDVLEKVAPWTDTSVGGRSDSVTWYQALRLTQGNPEAILEAGYAANHSEFPYESLHCEWGYIVDLDQMTFEVYKGYQHQPPTRGRWSTPERLQHEADMSAAQAKRLEEQGYSLSYRYYAVDMVGSWSLNALPSKEDVLALEKQGVEA